MSNIYPRVCTVYGDPEYRATLPTERVHGHGGRGDQLGGGREDGESGR